MSITTIDPKVAAAPARVPPDATGLSPRLLAGTELIGRVAGSGLREPPYLVRRCDGQVVQLSRLLYVIASRMDGRELAAIAAEAGQRLDLRITSEQIAYVAEHKLVPLGLVAPSDGTPPSLERLNALLALRFRAGVVGERPVNALASVLDPCFSRRCCSPPRRARRLRRLAGNVARDRRRPANRDPPPHAWAGAVRVDNPLARLP